jgi:hypothetical protein
MPGTEHTPKHAQSTEPVQYGQGWGGDLYRDVQVPSGAWCKIRRNLDPIELMTSDDPAAEKHDVLGSIVRQKIARASARASATGDLKAAKMASDVIDNVDSVLDSLTGNSGMGSLVNSFIVKLVVEPKLVFPPEDPNEREHGVVYVDTVPFQDRMFLFDLAMKGTAQMARFHSVIEGDLESLGDGENVSDSPQ